MTYDSESGDIVMALAGDALITRRFTVHKEESFTRLADIFRGADVGFLNLEGTVRNWDEGTPNLTQGMVERGYDEKNMRWVLGESWVRAIAKNIG